MNVELDRQYNEFMSAHLNTSIWTDEVLFQAKNLLLTIRESGREIIEPQEREILAAWARSLGEAIYDKSNEYPPVRIAPAEYSGQQTSVVRTGDGSTVVYGNNTTIQVGGSSSADTLIDPQVALNCYLERVIEENSHLQLQGTRSASGLVSIDLEEIYVTAKLTRLDQSRDNLQQIKVPVQTILTMQPRLVILGDPGSGKTTLLRYLALIYARDYSEYTVRNTEHEEHETLNVNWVQQKLGLDEHRMPVLLPLRDFARYLESECPDVGVDGPKLLLDYLRVYFTNQQIALPPGFFAARLEASECIVLLDSMDEIVNLMTRRRVARILENLTLAYPQNRYVVTSRFGGYSGSVRLAVDYVPVNLSGFSEAEIEQLVLKWNRAVEIAVCGETHTALQRAERQGRVFWEVFKKSDRLRELAVNPLFLTVLLLIHRYRAALPERRVEVYEETLGILLGQWDAAKGLPDSSMPDGINLDTGDRRTLLEPIARWMMEQETREIELYDLRSMLQQQLRILIRDERQIGKVIESFLDFVDERSGILIETQVGIYSFTHLVFQEYLVARCVANNDNFISYTLQRLENPWWREVILLECGHLSTQGRRRVTQLIRAIMECDKEPEPYHNLVLAAEAIQEVGPARVEGDILGEIRSRLRQVFETPLRGKSKAENLSGIQRRAAAAEALARLESGASGTQPAFWNLPYGEPMWVEVAAGEFWMGNENGRDDEKLRHKVYQERFWIARVPITNAQYQFFVEITGYRSPEHWEQGKYPKGKESHPVVNVSWLDAVAYCAWLSTVTGQTIALPTEAQWEKAARGAEPREYPWGNAFDETKSNNYALGLGDTTPVGIFPEGSSPYGCLDMGGNVREWTNSIYRNYPYNVFDGRENRDESQGALRVIRGGGFQSEPDDIRCSARSGLPLNTRASDVGFRVVVSRQILPELSRDLTTLREYLVQNFDAFGLESLCRDVFPDAYTAFSKGNTKSDKVDALLAYCSQKSEAGDRLLNLVREPGKMQVQASQIEHALTRARRVLAILEEQAAGYSALTIPVHLQIELEDKQHEVAALEKQMGGDTVAGAKITLTMFDQRGQSVSSQINVAGNHNVSLSDLRGQLARWDDAELDALCMDYFPAVYDKFGRGMRRDERINLLLDHCRRHPEEAQSLLSLLER